MATTPVNPKKFKNNLMHQSKTRLQGWRINLKQANKIMYLNKTGGINKGKQKF